MASLVGKCQGGRRTVWTNSLGKGDDGTDRGDEGLEIRVDVTQKLMKEDSVV